MLYTHDRHPCVYRDIGSLLPGLVPEGPIGILGLVGLFYQQCHHKLPVVVHCRNMLCLVSASPKCRGILTWLHFGGLALNSDFAARSLPLCLHACVCVTSCDCTLAMLIAHGLIKALLTRVPYAPCTGILRTHSPPSDHVHLERHCPILQRFQPSSSSTMLSWTRSSNIPI